MINLNRLTSTLVNVHSDRAIDGTIFVVTTINLFERSVCDIQDYIIVDISISRTTKDSSHILYAVHCQGRLTIGICTLTCTCGFVYIQFTIARLLIYRQCFRTDITTLVATAIDIMDTTTKNCSGSDTRTVLIVICRILSSLLGFGVIIIFGQIIRIGFRTW